MEEITEEEKNGCFSVIFNFFGWIASLLVLPIFASFLGFPQGMDFLSQYLGEYGAMDFLVFVAFVLIALRIGFGSSRLLLPTIFSFLLGGPLVFTALKTELFSSLQELIKDIPYLGSPALNFVIGVSTILLGVQLSKREQISIGAQVFFLWLLPVGALVGLSSANILQLDDSISISLKEGFAQASKGTKEAIARIDTKYRKDPKVENYIKEVVNDTKTEDEEKEQRIQELLQRIEKLEKDKELNAKVREENQRFKKEIELLESKSPSDSWCRGAHNDEKRVYSYEDAIMPGTPCVRDLAAHLASSHEGTLHRKGARGTPSKIGLKQIAAIHTYISDQWKYVNDPTRTGSDYYSPATRSISLGFVGDCDDFSIVMASLVAAIGATPRIMYGECKNGTSAHAFAEVLIGDKEAWTEMRRLLRKHYGSSSRTFAGHSKDGQYWLSLDWRLGELSCADSDLREDWVH